MFVRNVSTKCHLLPQPHLSVCIALLLVVLWLRLRWFEESPVWMQHPTENSLLDDSGSQGKGEAVEDNIFPSVSLFLGLRYNTFRKQDCITPETPSVKAGDLA